MSDEEINPFKMPAYTAPEVSDVVEEDIVPNQEVAIPNGVTEEDSQIISIVDAGGERREIVQAPDAPKDEDGLKLAIAMIQAEETARLTTEGFARTMFEVKHAFTPSVTVTAPPSEAGEVGSPRTVWGTRKIQQDDYTVNGTYKVLDILGKAGVIVDFIVSSASSDYRVSVNVDGVDLYEDTYTNLSTLAKSDSNLSVYQDTNTSYYVVAIHNIYFAFETKLIIGADSVEFNIIRVNYNVEV